MSVIPFEGGIMALSPSLIEAFHPFSEAVICHISYKSKFLLLKRREMVAEGNKWGMPGGKIEPGEVAIQAMTREVAEETAILLQKEKIHFVETFYVRRYPKKDLILHLFKTVVPTDALRDGSIALNKEHTAYIWVNWLEACQLDLISGGSAMLKHIERMIS